MSNECNVWVRVPNPGGGMAFKYKSVKAAIEMLRKRGWVKKRGRNCWEATCFFNRKKEKMLAEIAPPIYECEPGFKLPSNTK